jgi:hypothetical protein
VIKDACGVKEDVVTKIKKNNTMCHLQYVPLTEVIKYACGVKEDVVTKIKKKMLRWFGHGQRMDERRLTKEIYEADMGGNAGQG